MQITSGNELGDQFSRRCLEGRLNDVAHGSSPINGGDAGQLNDKATTKQTPTAGQQAIFGPHIVIRRHDEGDVVEIEPVGVWRRLGKIVLLGMKVTGAARVHRETVTKHTNPEQSSHNTDIFGKANY
jgi:hypothetical protein